MNSNAYSKNIKRTRRRKQIRKKVRGTTTMPRISVFRSLKNIYAQIIDDFTGTTIIAASSVQKDIKNKKKSPVSRIEQCELVGKTLAALAKKKGIDRAVFDRSGYKYHGRVKALAEAARNSGLQF